MVMKRFFRRVLIALVLGISLAVFLYGLHQETLRKEEEAQRKEAADEVNSRLDDCRRRVFFLQSAYAEEQSERLAYYSDPAVQAEIVRTGDLPLLAIGDSVMLGAKYNLEKRFPNGVVDARENRSFWPAYTILEEASKAEREFYPVVIGIGTNSPLDLSVCRRIIELCGDRQVFWLTTTNNWQFYNTDNIRQLAEEYENVTVIDWDTCSRGHEEYFYSDAIHLKEAGREAYADLIYSAITERCFSLLPKEDHRVFLIGDAFLLSCMNDLDLPEGEICVLAEEDLSASLMEKRTQELLDAGILPEEIVLVFSKTRLLESDLLNRILSRFPDQSITMIAVNDTEPAVLSHPETIELFEYTPNRDDYSLDQKHLSAQGSAAFAEFLMETIFSEDDQKKR